ncbi:MAG: serine phosphatase RsbU (regulator of sigma subunit)/HD-like signal output (HDOD) protein [Candidatus Krumholzibacteriia bacterium]|jgi:serine phosphatase RsbU (regulator of sigma subunit)/HD-like signal output (HDOD) protein
METKHRYFVSELVAQVGSLPALAAHVVNQTSDHDCDLGKLSRLILADNVLTMRFLALANSAAISHGHEVKNLKAALIRLGIRRVRNVALLMGMHDMSPTREIESGINMAEYWKHCLAVASCAQGLAWQRGLETHEDAWMVGILHRIGVTSAIESTGRAYLDVASLAREQKVSLATAEMQVLEFHHGEFGSRILKEWKLPRIFSEVVEFYTEDFDKSEVSPEAAGLITVLRDAIAIVRTIGFGECGDHDPLSDINDLANRLGLPAQALEALGAKVDREVNEMSGLIGLSMPENVFTNAIRDTQLQVARMALEGFDDAMVREDLEEQMSIARVIQQRILPQATPTHAGLEIAAANFPSKAVSGDTYDFITLKGGACGLVIADVSGKGMPAALLASTLQASMRALASVFSDPGELLTAANGALFESSDPERFATLFLAVFSEDGTNFRYASAGHNPPLIFRQDGTQEWLKPSGTPLGMMPEMSYQVTEVAMAPGDLMVAYTDGITEAVNDHDVEFDEVGVLAITTAESQNPPHQIIDRMIAAVHNHVSGWIQTGTGSDGAPDAGDDLTMLVVKKL